MNWKVFNEGKQYDLSVDGIKCTVIEDLMDEQIDVFSETGSHLIEIKMGSQKFHSEDRRLKFKKQCEEQGLQWECKQYGYFVMVKSDKTISEINLNVEGLGYSETEDILKDVEANKSEIEFVQKIVNSLNL